MCAGFFGSYFRRQHRTQSADSSDSPKQDPTTPEDLTAGAEKPAVEPALPENPAEAASPTPPTDKNADPTSPATPPAPEDASAPVPDAATEPPPAASDDSAARLNWLVDYIDQQPDDGPSDSPIDELMRDTVVQALINEGLLTTQQALVALQQRQQAPGEALWRIAARVKGVDAARIYEAAARLQGCASVPVGSDKPTVDFVEAVLGLFDAAVADRLLQHGVLPYEFVIDAQRKQHSLILASADPTAPTVEALVKQMGLHAEVRYAPQAPIRDRIQAVRFARVKAAGTDAKPEAKDALPDLDWGTDLEPPQVFIDPIGSLRTDDVAGGPEADAADDDVITIDGHANAGDDEHQSIQPGFGAAQGDDATGDETSVVDGADGGEGAPPPEGDGVATDLPPEPTDVSAAEVKAMSKDRVVAMLLRKEVITPNQAAQAQQVQQDRGNKETLWRVLTTLPTVDREAIFAEAARVYAFKTAKMGNGKPDPDFARSVVETFPEEYHERLLQMHVVPFECDLEPQTGAIKLCFITHDPTRPEVNRMMQLLKLERFELQYAPETLVKGLINEAFPRRNEYLDRVQEDGGMAFDLGTSYDEEAGLIDEDALEAEISRSKLINLFEATLVEAVRQGASDIHIYPNAQKKVEIHFRVDGRLSRWHLEDKVHPEALLAVIKDNTMNVDRFEREAAQDGFIQRWIDDALIRFRVSVLPIANAVEELRSESIVIRVLDDRKVITDLEKLGLLDRALERFNRAIRQPHGMVILTGPTGSGKSTTLVAALHQVVSPEVNVLTVEDPVEYIIPGVRQIKLNYKLGLEDALRSILRHDPDIVMVGEMRDKETAELAIKLANTGHLTFSTLHTNDATAAISRLYKMGIEPFLIAYAINLVVAQRLIRCLCPACKVVDDDVDHIMLDRLGFNEDEIQNGTFYLKGEDSNCPTCKGVGFKGRRAVCEALYFSRAIRHLIVESEGNLDEGDIRDLAVKEGMMTLQGSAREIVRMGETSVLEMIRVTTTDE